MRWENSSLFSLSFSPFNGSNKCPALPPPPPPPIPRIGKLHPTPSEKQLFRLTGRPIATVARQKFLVKRSFIFSGDYGATASRTRSARGIPGISGGIAVLYWRSDMHGFFYFYYYILYLFNTYFLVLLA